MSREVASRGRWLFWGLTAVIFLLSVVPSVVLIEKAQDYYRFLTGSDRGVLRQLKVDFLPHRDTPVQDTPEINYVEFRIHVPQAKSVNLVGSFNQWQGLPLKRERSDTWRVLLPLPKGTHYYAFEVDGAWTLDPKSAETSHVAGREASVRRVP